MSMHDDVSDLRLHPRPSETVSLSIPSDTLATIREIAAARDMEPEALMKLYIGSGLRRDVAIRFEAGETVERAEPSVEDPGWAGEIERRVNDLRSGAVKPIPGEQVLDELGDLFR